MPAALQRHFGRVKHAAGLSGPDGGKDEDGKKLRPWAGNSPNVIHRHYKGLVKEADATEFGNLTPAAVKNEIVKFPNTKAA